MEMNMKKFNLLAGLMVAGTLVAAPAAFADNGHHGKNNAAHAQYKAKKQVKAKKAYHSDRDDRNWRNVNGSYQQLPPGLQKNVARGKAVPPGWAKKLDDRYYYTTVRNGKSVYILNDDVYRNARIIGYPRDGVVRVNVDNRTVEILEATRAILNVLN
jgi:hypothetical protein